MNRFSIGSDNGLSPIRRWAIFLTSAGLLSIGPFSEISIKNIHFFFQENASENIVCEMVAILSRGRWVNNRYWKTNMNATYSYIVSVLEYHQVQANSVSGFRLWFSGLISLRPVKHLITQGVITSHNSIVTKLLRWIGPAPVEREFNKNWLPRISYDLLPLWRSNFNTKLCCLQCWITAHQVSQSAPSHHYNIAINMSHI